MKQKFSSRDILDQESMHIESHHGNLYKLIHVPTGCSVSFETDWPYNPSFLRYKIDHLKEKISKTYRPNINN